MCGTRVQSYSYLLGGVIETHVEILQEYCTKPVLIGLIGYGLDTNEATLIALSAVEITSWLDLNMGAM